jgi:hypothetical protein
MCQKAVGNVFAALAPMPREHLTWLGEPPDLYESSSVAARGFCRMCGTPLTFEYKGSGRVNVTIGSLDDPGAVQPVIHYGVESRVAWLKLCDGLPEETYDPNSEPLHGMKNYQHPDR